MTRNRIFRRFNGVLTRLLTGERPWTESFTHTQHGPRRHTTLAHSFASHLEVRDSTHSRGVQQMGIRFALDTEKGKRRITISFDRRDHCGVCGETYHLIQLVPFVVWQLVHLIGRES